LKENLRDLAPVMEETGRVIFQNGSITVNLLPALIALALLGALLLKLFFGLTMMDVMDAMVGGSSYGTPYSTSGSGYAAPAPASSYGTPSAGYDAHTAGYSARSSYYDDENVELTAEQRSLYPELAKLQDDIERLRLNEVQLRNQLFLNNAAGSGDLASAASGQIGYYN